MPKPASRQEARRIYMAMQQQMGHAAFSTTRKYAKYAQEHAGATYDVHLPASLKAQAKGLKIADGAQKTG
jgi:hypothetical protein